MKLLGFLLLFSGWIIAFASLAMLGIGAPRVVFLILGIGVEMMGLVLVTRAHPLVRGARE